MANEWPTCGPGGYRTPAAWQVPEASHGDIIRSGPQVDQWLHNPCRLGGGGSLTLHSGGQNQKWPTNGPSAYMTVAVWGVPEALERETRSHVAHKWARCLRKPCRPGVPDAS